MENVVASIRSVTQTMAEIREASLEQSSAIEHVNQSVIEMEAVTQKNVAMVEAASVTSAALNDQVRRLVSVVRVFRLVR